ncbi:MAG: transcriptional regulator [Aeromicrobium erythreum]
MRSENAGPEVSSVDDAPTRDRVAATLLERGPSTAAALADDLGLTPAAVRRHLDQLVSAGTVDVREQRTVGRRGRGRPAKEFVLTDAGRERFEHAYDDLATDALAFLAETAGPDAVKAFAVRRLQPLRERYAAQVAAADPSDRAQALAEALSADGFAASARRGPAGDQVCQHHCPVAHVAEQFPQLCEAETELFAELLGTHVQRLATIAHGDGVCTTHLPTIPRQAVTTERATS